MKPDSKYVIKQYMHQLASSRGIALATSLMWMGMLMVMGTGLVSFTTSGTVRVSGEENRALALNGADAGLQQEYNSLWRPFRTSQRFDSLDASCTGSSTASSTVVQTGSLGSGVRYTVGVVKYDKINNWSRRLTIRSVGWVDINNSGGTQPDAGEPSRLVETQIQLSLERSKVFDYAYFVNTYGWMYGFSSNELIVNGDMRANGDFDFSGGSPTINGSVYACRNTKLIPAATGLVNITPTQWSNATYNSNAPQTARQAYQASRMGDKGSDEYELWRDLIYDQNASVVRGSISGAVVADANGTRTYNGTVLNPEPTQEVLMPDLSDISYYQTQSQNYVDQKQKFLDGSNNPYYGQGSYIDVYNANTKKYERVTTNGVYNGSIALIGTTANPIKVHGPVTVTGDVVIKGVVEGQSTIYAGRNVHIVGNITYKQGPNFSGNDVHLTDKANEKKDFLGLAARASVIMGNTKTISSTALKYMTPPFTKARYDDDGDLIPAYNAKEIDSTGRMRYQSTFSDAYINSISENVNQINGVLYTNFLGGGDIGQGGSGVTFNGSIISRDEAMILKSLPLKLNYDNRLRQRLDINEPLIDLKLPVAPTFMGLTWDEL